MDSPEVTFTITLTKEEWHEVESGLMGRCATYSYPETTTALRKLRQGYYNAAYFCGHVRIYDVDYKDEP